MNEKSLVDDFLAHRSEKVFRSLYSQYTPRLYMVALRLTAGDKHEAAELIQQMWCIAIEKLWGFEWKSTFNTWLCGILINLNRARARERKFENLDKETSHNTNQSQMDDELEYAISKLPNGYRQAIILHDIEGYKHHEIADMLGIAEGTSKSQLFDARKALRKLLKSN